ncbi:MAG TPA: rRNA maturation RNase YbeY [Anaerolineaceae bacterium]|nr:rRNA maturation RNase YbeY [Anaerolineaceae bacterium]
MLTIKSRQAIRKELDKNRLREVSATSFRFLGFETEPQVTLQVTDDKTIQEFNLQYRDTDEATDVLSFENAFIDPESGETYLGDILISYETAKRQADSRGLEMMTELEMLLVHGILHLTGMDHASQSDWQAMSNMQDAILAELNNPIQKSIHDPN